MIKYIILLSFILCLLMPSIGLAQSQPVRKLTPAEKLKAENDKNRELYWLQTHGTPIRTVLSKHMIEWYPACRRRKDGRILAYRSWGVVQVFKSEKVVDCPDFFK